MTDQCVKVACKQCWEAGSLLTPGVFLVRDPASPARAGGSLTTEPPRDEGDVHEGGRGLPYRLCLESQATDSSKHCFPVRPLNTEQKRLESVDRKHIIFHRKPRTRVSPMTGVKTVTAW